MSVSSHDHDLLWARKDLILSKGVVGKMSSHDGTIELETMSFYPLPSNPQKQSVDIIFLTGWDESYVKYFALFEQLTSEGFIVHTMDHRSQGCSGRSPQSPNLHMSHVEVFEEYVDDFAKFATSIATRSPGKKLSIIAHSMGGLISLKSLLRPTLSSVVTCACLSAPMLQVSPKT